MSGVTLVETSQGLLAMGGIANVNDRWSYRKEIFKLTCPDDHIEKCQWKELEQKLDPARSGHVSIPLPESFDVCNKAQK